MPIDMTALEAILRGSNSERDLVALQKSITDAANDEQYTFCFASEIVDFVSGDGLEILYEQDWSLDEFRQCLVAVGLVQVEPIFDRLDQLIPRDLKEPVQQPGLYPLIRAKFSELKDLADQFYQATTDVNRVLADYVRLNAAQFRQHH